MSNRFLGLQLGKLGGVLALLSLFFLMKGPISRRPLKRLKSPQTMCGRGQFSKISWFGRGPFENYWDRKTAAFVGLYNSTVEEQYFPYIRPQENGYKTDVRWFALQSKEGPGLMFIGDSEICFSAL